MAEFNLNRIRFTWKGEWQISTTYTVDDIVYYEGKAYVCIVGHISSINFYNELNNETPIWELMFDGNRWLGDWQSDFEYSLDNIIKFKGFVYQCIIPHRSTNVANLGPASQPENWKIVATTYNWLGNWDTNIFYNQGDVIKYKGITYIAIAAHRSAATESDGLEKDIEKWQIVTRSDNWLLDWNTGSRYAKDDIVRYGAFIYRCILEHTASADIEQGLEADIEKWQVVLEGIEYRGLWQGEDLLADPPISGLRYRKNDIVKSNATLYICLVPHTSQTLLSDDESKWKVWLPGLGYEELWNSTINYRKGDIVLYGGYAYTALTNNINSVPSVNGIIQDTGDWELLKEGYRFRGEWNDTTEYLTGDVVRNSGYLYIAERDVSADFPDTSVDWKVLVPGYKWQAEWEDDTLYYLGDIVTLDSTAYYCINRHSSVDSETRPDLDIENPTPEFWNVLTLGSDENRLRTIGDLVTFQESDSVRFPIGAAGETLKVLNSADAFAWEDFERVNQVFFVSPNGVDEEDRGRTLNSPFKTIQFATNFILNNVNTEAFNTTLFIKTGLYQEALPIRVPRNCAVVGDELRSTTVQPAVGFETSNMFLVRNGSGIRNMTLQGLQGELGEPNEYLTRRPTAGAYVSLDPGEGPDDESVWIKTKSCYVQNVSTFGTGCIGMKVDGSLHNGGNRSIVANDFTQVLSDGIGYWADNLGRSELVSVFTYFCYMGYLSTNGGILRATNGNNSYGTFGSRAEGVNENEVPLNATIDNRSNEAQTSVTHTNGNEILAIGFEHAGQEYTDASIEFSGTGVSADANFEEIRNNAISQVRLIDPADSSTPGGINYQTLLNNAQGGNDKEIFLSAADTTGTPEKYIGLRIFIEAGKGVGQYAVITGYDAITKKVTVSREFDLGAGWEHVYSGFPIEPTLDSTTRYRIEPRAVVDEPDFTAQSTAVPVDSWQHITYGDDTWVAVTGGGPAGTSAKVIYSSNNGETWSSPVDIGSGYTIIGIVYTGQKFIIGRGSFDGSPHDTYLESTDGVTWTEVLNIDTPTIFTDIESDGNGHIYLLGANNTITQSTDNGSTWSTLGLGTSQIWSKIAINKTTNLVVIPEVGGTGDVAIIDSGAISINSEAVTPAQYTDAVYGNGRFVAISAVDKLYTISFNGNTWFENNSEAVIGETISYGAGVFVSPTDSVVYKSYDGLLWKEFAEDSSLYSLGFIGQWKDIAYNNNRWILIQDNSPWSIVQTGAPAFVRVVIASSRVDSFIVYNPGSGYNEVPNLQLVDPLNTIDSLYDVRKNNGVLPQPVINNRGEGYTTATSEITGDGFADIYQIGNSIKVSNLTKLPGPGDNFEVDGIDDRIYRVVKIENLTGTVPNLEADIQISPSIGNQESPDHDTDIVIRQEYSQVRLTGHDFLDIGTGNSNATRYPELYIFGQTSENATRPENETSEVDGGRIFYTSTDQDGNFRVGELFRVEQSTGIVSITADFFDLEGLTEISIGGIVVGGSAVVIREFSKEASFVANSNNIVPTERAIARYLESRISSGGSDAITNTLVAGQVRVSGNTISTTSDNQINIPVKVNQVGPVDGDYAALLFYGLGSKVN